MLIGAKPDDGIRFWIYGKSAKSYFQRDLFWKLALPCWRQQRKGALCPRWPRLPLPLHVFLGEPYAAWPLQSPRPAPRGLSVFDFGIAFSIPDKRSRGTKVFEGVNLPLRNPENPRN